MNLKWKPFHLLVLTAMILLPALTITAQDVVNLTVTVWVGQTDLEALEELADVFEGANPNIAIEYLNIPDTGDFGRNTVQQMIAGGTPPDVMILNTGQFETFAARGVLLALDDLVERDGVDLGIYFPEAISGSSFDGVLYGMPRDISNHLVYLNVEMFEAAGVDLPDADWTWDDYRSIAQALTMDTDGDGTIDQWGTSIINAVWAWGGFVWSNGGEILSDDRKECLLTQAATVEALEYYYGLLTEAEASIPPGSLPQTPWQGDQFINGMIGMGTFGPWWRPPLVEIDPFEWTLRPYPHSPSGDQPTVALYTDQWAISAATGHPEEAWTFVHYLTSPEGQQVWAEIFGSRSIPPIIEVATSDRYLNYGGDMHRADNELVLEVVGSTNPPPTNFSNGAAVENVWNEEFELVMIGQKSVGEATEAICARVAPLLAEG